MAREIVKNLKFKKHTGKFFDPELFAQLLDESYRNTKRADGEMTKKSFSPSSLGYGHGKCPRYWYMAFSGAVFVDDTMQLQLLIWHRELRRMRDYRSLFLLCLNGDRKRKRLLMSILQSEAL